MVGRPFTPQFKPRLDSSVFLSPATTNVRPCTSRVRATFKALRLRDDASERFSGRRPCVEEQEMMMTHLRRNRYYEDKYKKGGSGVVGGAEDMLASYVVTPAPEWFR